MTADEEKQARAFLRGLSPETANPRAREVLTEPACWDGRDHTSPFGETQASEMLVAFLPWRKKHPRGKAITLLKAVLKETGADDKRWDAVEPEAVRKVIADDEYGIGIRDPAVIGLAFAQLVVEGRVDDDVRGLAMLAIRRQDVAVDRLWSSQHFDLDERRRCLGAMLDALGRLGPVPEAAPARITRAKPEPARAPMVVAFYAGDAGYPTSDGRVLRFGEDPVRGEVRLKFDPRDESNDLPSDVLAAELRVADSEGRVWSLSSRFSSEVFLIHMVDLAAMEWLQPFARKARAAFKRDLLLEDVRLSSDDRFFRRFAVGKKIVEVQFKYTVMTFDVAIARDEMEGGEPILTRLLVRLNEDSLFDAEGEPVPALAFSMDWRYLFRHNTFAAGPGGASSILPLPMAFRPTEDRGEPWAGVRVTG